MDINITKKWISLQLYSGGRYPILLRGEGVAGVNSLSPGLKRGPQKTLLTQKTEEPVPFKAPGPEVALNGFAEIIHFYRGDDHFRQIS